MKEFILFVARDFQEHLARNREAPLRAYLLYSDYSLKTVILRPSAPASTRDVIGLFRSAIATESDLKAYVVVRHFSDEKLILHGGWHSYGLGVEMYRNEDYFAQIQNRGNEVYFSSLYKVGFGEERKSFYNLFKNLRPQIEQEDLFTQPVYVFPNNCVTP